MANFLPKFSKIRVASSCLVWYFTSTMITGTTHKKAAEWVEQIRQLCKPDSVYWCDGSEEENTQLCDMLVEKGTYIRLNPEKRPG